VVRLPSISARTYRRITLATLVAVAVIVVTGAAVRLTGSGLGCSDWPACTDNQLVSVTGYHQQIEQINRLFTGLVSVAVIGAVLGSVARFPRRRDLIWWSLGLVAGMVGQIVLGGITVLFDLWPPLVMGHFVLSAILIWNAVVLHDRAGHGEGPGVLSAPVRARTLGRVMVGLAAAVLVTGTVVTGTGPHGGDENVARLPFIVEDVARIHSLTAWAFLVVTIAFAWLIYRQSATPQARGRVRWLILVIVAQGALGYTQYVLGVPPGLVALHVAGSVAVWVTTLVTYLGLFSFPAEDAVEVGGSDIDENVTASAQ